MKYRKTFNPVLTIPRRKHIHQTDYADPVKWHYIPGTRLFYLHRLRMALSMLGSRKYERLLEIGFGSGIFLPELSRRCAELYGIDIHDNIPMVEEMMQKEGLKSTLSKASATAIPYPDTYFDGIVCVSVLEHIRDVSTVIREIRRVTTKNGIIVLGFPGDNVLNRVTLRILYLWHPNAKLAEEHVSTHKEILKEVRSYLHLSQTRQFPSFVPLDYALYSVWQCQVNNV